MAENDSTPELPTGVIRGIRDALQGKIERERAAKAQNDPDSTPVDSDQRSQFRILDDDYRDAPAQTDDDLGTDDLEDAEPSEVDDHADAEAAFDRSADADETAEDANEAADEGTSGEQHRGLSAWQRFRRLNHHDRELEDGQDNSDDHNSPGVRAAAVAAAAAASHAVASGLSRSSAKFDDFEGKFRNRIESTSASLENRLNSLTTSPDEVLRFADDPEHEPHAMPDAPPAPCSDRRPLHSAAMASLKVRLDERVERDGEEATVNKMRMVMFALIGVVMVIALVLGLRSLSQPLISFKNAGYNQSGAPGAAVTKTTEHPVDPKSKQPADGEKQPASLGPEPQIESIAQRSPDGDGRDHPELTGKMLDGNADTAWRSRYFKQDSFKNDFGIALAIKLKEPTTISKFSMNSDSQGGRFRLVASSPDDPWHGRTLAEGEFGPDVHVTFEPTKTQYVTLQILNLPKGKEGRNRAWIGEVSLGR